MAEVVYTSEVRLTRLRGALRLAYLPAESEPVRFGTHGPIARHYGIQGEVADPTRADSSGPWAARWRRAGLKRARAG